MADLFYMRSRLWELENEYYMNGPTDDVITLAQQLSVEYAGSMTDEEYSTVYRVLQAKGR